MSEEIRSSLIQTGNHPGMDVDIVDLDKRRTAAYAPMLYTKFESTLGIYYLLEAPGNG